MNCVKCGKWMFFGDVDTFGVPAGREKMAEWSAPTPNRKSKGISARPGQS